jgi:transcription initiation factor TFIID subunit 1
LKQLGLSDPAALQPEKLQTAVTKLCQDDSSVVTRQICKLILDNVVASPWNLSQSFLISKQTKQMMLLEGVGDPSQGHGGVSFLRMPLKASEADSKAKDSRVALNPAMKNPKAITGTDADLRRLTKIQIKQKLIEMGYTNEDLGRLSRWDMIQILKDKSIDGDNKFIRGERMTTKQQREVYQTRLNELLQKQIDAHTTLQNYNSSDDEVPVLELPT